jgi:transcriptional regulator with XRE-family HTH domain
MTTIRDARVKRGISQKELARAAGIDARTLRKIENGEHVSDLSQKAVEQVLGVSAEVAVPTASQSARRGFNYRIKFGLSVVAFLILVLGICWGSGPLFWPAYVAMSFIVLTVSAAYYWVDNEPLPGNTYIEIRADLAAAVGFGDLHEMAKGWLGRSDITVRRIVTDKSGLRFTVRGDFDVREYPGLVQKLRGFGLDASVSTAY